MTALAGQITGMMNSATAQKLLMKYKPSIMFKMMRILTSTVQLAGQATATMITVT